MKMPLIGTHLPSGLQRTATGWLSILGLLAVLACIGAPGSHAQSPPASGSAPASQPQAAAPVTPAVPPAAAPAVDQDRQQIEGECASLLQLATALKTEVDKTTMDQLSISVVLKAGQIEQLAHKVRGEMKTKVGDQ